MRLENKTNFCESEENIEWCFCDLELTAIYGGDAFLQSRLVSIYGLI